jgi:glyoxylase-like metal-dependent hydrolase (beta-lactamase superfamily II)/peptidoglycan/xylan/chitin deacetylase (PgdA/CDA1 family)
VKRAALAVVVALAFGLQSAWVLYSQTAKPPGPLTTVRVTGDLHMVSGEGGNVALYVTGEGVVLVDDMFDRNHEDILKQVRAVTEQPLRYVINTHQHDDHAGGDFKMLRIAEVIAHKNVRANLLNIKQPYYEDTPGTPIGLPRLTFTDEMTLNLGAGEVRAHYFGRGHTSGDAVILFPRERVIHTGDLFLNFPPRPRADGSARPPGASIYVDSAQGGSFLEWSRTLERTLALDFDTVIPGHGPLAKKADLARFAASITAMRDRIAGLVRGGASKAEVLKVLEDDYGWRSTGCPPSPPTGGCLQYQQIDSLLAELRGGAAQTAPSPSPVNRQVAITIDDLPRGGDSRDRSLVGVLAMTRKLLTPFRDQRVPVIGFVNQGRQADFDLAGLRQLLDVWLDYGADLGNHSHSHLNINRVPLQDYLDDIVKGEPILKQALEARGRPLTFFRHPFLFTGPTAETKLGMQAFLDARGYRVAPVTLDNADYQWASLYTRPEHHARVRQEYVPYMDSVVKFFEERSVEVVGREFPQILLIHANQLNADLMPDLLGMFKRRGYTFVTLDQALADPAYRQEDGYVGRNGFSWIHRWSRTKGMTPRGEPEPPAWVRKASS